VVLTRSRATPWRPEEHSPGFSADWRTVFLLGGRMNPPDSTLVVA
jgi:hypothetical protein